jgi:hypothetical protein
MSIDEIWAQFEGEGIGSGVVVQGLFSKEAQWLGCPPFF